MNGLSLDALNLSTAEHLSYTQAFRELAEVPEGKHHDESVTVVRNPGDYNTHMALSIPEVRRWLGEHFCTIPLGQIDQILQMTSVQENSSGRMTGVQFFAALRITIHAQAGAGVIVKSAFKQASGLSSLLQTSSSSCTQQNVASSPPPEILERIFYFMLNVRRKYCYKPQSSIVPLLMVNKRWSGVAYRRLYRSISMGPDPGLNVAGMLHRTLSENPQYAALVIELRMAPCGESVVDYDVHDHIALLDLCINLKHVDIFGYEIHELEGCRRVLAQRSLISIHIKTENYYFLKNPPFCSTGDLLEMMQGWPDLEKLHISHVTPSDSEHIPVRNNCCPRLKNICISEGEYSANLLLQLPKMTQAVERLHLKTAWRYEYPASSVFPAIRAWKNSLRWFHYAPKKPLDVHPSCHPHLIHLKYFETNSTALPASYLQVVSPNVSTLRYMATIEDFHYITTNLCDLAFLSSLTLLYIYPLPDDWNAHDRVSKLPEVEDDVQSLKKICAQRSIQLVLELYPSPRVA